MAKKKRTTAKPRQKKKKNNSIVSFFKSKQTHLVFGVFILSSAIFLFMSFYSFLQHWKEDQSQLQNFSDRAIAVKNLLGKLGAKLSHFFVYEGFGIATFIFPVLLFFTGLYIILNIQLKQLNKFWVNGILAMIWFSIIFAVFIPDNNLFAGTVGFEVNEFLQIYMGKTGVILLMGVIFLIFIISKLKITPEKIKNIIPKVKEKKDNLVLDDVTGEGYITEAIHEGSNTELELSVNSDSDSVIVTDDFPVKEKVKATVQEMEVVSPKEVEVVPPVEEELEIEVKKPVDEELIVENLSNTLVKDFGEFDPTLELANYKFPELSLLRDYTNENITIDKQELENNKNKIVDTLNNYKIGISSIKATIGPTVTLYEIVPNAGVRISKIKNLEDDIALSLAALGIRIIAPIPGKGTIGIEVPNKKPSIVSMKSVLSSQKFQNTKMDLPLALGKTISNETFIVDLAKMPHLLMAGATGQGKSVGLNAVLASLIYKKHPAEIKFVLVDPKKVELTLFNKIERHYLAKLPDTEEAIITDTTAVINTLNSLCIEMDNRYDLLKNAFVRNIKEYNVKFKSRKLNPENGHRFLPYIVLVIDEFADLIMTAGKEIETPIARLSTVGTSYWNSFDCGNPKTFCKCNYGYYQS